MSFEQINQITEFLANVVTILGVIGIPLSVLSYLKEEQNKTIIYSDQPYFKIAYLSQNPPAIKAWLAFKIPKTSKIKQKILWIMHKFQSKK